MSEVLCRAEAYGLIERRHDAEEPRWRSVLALTDEWRVLLTLRERSEADGGAYPRAVARVGNGPPQY